MELFDRAFVILLDGARPDYLRELVARGDMPMLARHVVERGSAVDAVTVFPSTTGPAHLPYVTGRFPGFCNIPGIRWFDRASYATSPFRMDRFRSYMGAGSMFLGRDIDARIRTVFDEVSDHALVGGTVTKGCAPSRNLTRYGRVVAAARSFIAEDWFSLDRLSWKHLVRAAQDGTVFTFAAFYSIDAQAHKRGPRSAESFAAYRRLDGAIGDLARTLLFRGDLDRTLITVVSDHGESETHTHFDLAKTTERVVGATLAHPFAVRRWFSTRSAVMVSGNSMANVYVASRHGWAAPVFLDAPEPPLARLAETFLAERAVDVIAGRSVAGGVVIRSQRGSAHVELNQSNVVYSVDRQDPFGFPALPARMTRDEALARTVDTDYPDALVQLAQLFESRRTGDIVVSAAPGFDLRARYEKPPHVGSHGSLHRDHMLVPLFVNRRLGAGPFRSVDVHPTVLAGLGLDVPTDIDGRQMPLAPPLDPPVQLRP